MIVEIIGKQHREGVSQKTGKEYNFNVAHYIGPDRGVIGAKGLEVILEPDLYPLESTLPFFAILLSVVFALTFKLIRGDYW